MAVVNYATSINLLGGKCFLKITNKIKIKIGQKYKYNDNEQVNSNGRNKLLNMNSIIFYAAN